MSDMRATVRIGGCTTRQEFSKIVQACVVAFFIHDFEIDSESRMAIIRNEPLEFDCYVNADDMREMEKALKGSGLSMQVHYLNDDGSETVEKLGQAMGDTYARIDEIPVLTAKAIRRALVDGTLSGILADMDLSEKELPAFKFFDSAREAIAAMQESRV